jgi:hypothetical protein
MIYKTLIRLIYFNSTINIRFKYYIHIHNFIFCVYTSSLITAETVENVDSETL